MPRKATVCGELIYSTWRTSLWPRISKASKPFQVLACIYLYFGDGD